MVVRVGALVGGGPQGIQTDLASSLSGRCFIMLKKIQVFVQAFSKYWQLEEMPLYVYKSQRQEYCNTSRKFLLMYHSKSRPDL